MAATIVVEVPNRWAICVVNGAASMEAMPAMLEQMPQMMGGIEEAMAVLPPQRGFADLSEAERSRLAALLDITVPELKVSMEAAEAEKGELADE